MIEPVIAFAVERLKDDTSGLMATLPSCPFDGAAPVLPDTVRVIGGFDEAWAARGDMPEAELKLGPLLVVRQAGEIELAFMPADVPGQSPINIAVHYAALGTKTHLEYRIAHAVLRTAQRVLTQAFAAIPENDPEFARGGGFIQRPTRVTYLPPFDEGSDAVNSLACVIPFPVFDAWALGAP
jgi:hypothetical protein